MKSSHGDDGSDEASMSSDDEEYDPGKDPDAAWGDQDGKPDIRANKVARKIRKPKGKGLQLEEDDDEIVHETTDVPSTKNGSSPPKEMKINVRSCTALPGYARPRPDTLTMRAIMNRRVNKEDLWQ
mmetsp:Transcript_8854/g.39236  ORF Transcript_8854/g.39236 Transcript_8854/m.39236 type:complete len:126 (-) Transcript_8854:1620-1997(-)